VSLFTGNHAPGGGVTRLSFRIVAADMGLTRVSAVTETHDLGRDRAVIEPVE
jgi:hypothetical protein